MGKLRVNLTNISGGVRKTIIYMAKGVKQSLLGKEDTNALGIQSINLKGKGPEQVGCISPQKKCPEDKKGIVSDGKTQKEMERIKGDYQEVFKSMGRAKIDAI